MLQINLFWKVMVCVEVLPVQVQSIKILVLVVVNIIKIDLVKIVILMGMVKHQMEEVLY